MRVDRYANGTLTGNRVVTRDPTGTILARPDDGGNTYCPLCDNLGSGRSMEPWLR